jgi:Fic-DOC domain mobile mystery protein B
MLLDDAQLWVAQSVYQPDELAVRFHHKLVWIHPFPNGNGRHSRMLGDLLARQLGAEPFTWGSSGNLTQANTLRTRYVAALRAADRHDITPLLAFVRS